MPPLRFEHRSDTVSSSVRIVAGGRQIIIVTLTEVYLNDVPHYARPGLDTRTRTRLHPAP